MGNSISPTVNIKKLKITGTNLNDEISTGAYDSDLSTTKGYTVDGRKGNDTIIGSELNNKLYGGAGNDSIMGVGGKNYINGGAGNDILIGGVGDDSIIGGAGDDTIIGSTGNDSISAGTGNTEIDFSNYYSENIENTNTIIKISKNSSVNIKGLLPEDEQKLLIMQETGNKNNIMIIDKNGNLITVKDALNAKNTARVLIDGVSLTEKPLMDTITGGDISHYAKKDKYTGTKASDIIDGRTITEGFTKGLTLNGGAGNDIIYGSNLSKGDKLYGGAGNDTIKSGNGNDKLYGGAGNDSIIGVSGNNKLYGDAGNDYIEAGSGKDTIYGGKGNDSIFGSSDNSVLNGDKGNDYLEGGSGSDSIYGGSGSDTIIGTIGNALMNGGNGNDYFEGGSGNDTIYGGAGNDEIVLFDGNNIVDGGAGNDIVFIAPKDESDPDNPVGYEGTNIVKTGTGNDIVYGGVHKGDCLFDGGSGDDCLWGGFGNDSVYGGTGNDTIYGNEKGNKTLDGGKGNDIIFGGKGNDSIIGGAGNDTIYGGTAGGENIGDSISGGAGNDYIAGGSNKNSILDGGAGNDFIVGSASDTIIGGTGNDKLKAGYEGVGDSTFVFGLNAGNDTIIGVAGTASNNHTLAFDEGTTINGAYFDDKGLELKYIDSKKKASKITITNYANIDNINDIKIGGVASKSIRQYLADDSIHTISALNKKTSVEIVEYGGEDTLKINAKAKDVRAIVNIVKDEDTYKVADDFIVTYTNKSCLNASYLESALLPNTEAKIGVRVINKSGESDIGIEKVKLSNKTVQTDILYGKIAEEVGKWLQGTEYNSAYDAVNAYHNDNSIDISGLVAAYNKNYMA